jgi:Spy/CpxP family protein refolding chaperone
MKLRVLIGLMAAVTVGFLAGASTIALGGHAIGRPVMARVATALVDDALDHVAATPEQRAVAHQARERVFAVAEEHHQSRGARLETLLALFESDRMSEEQVGAVRRSIEADHAKMADAISASLVEVHDTLTPEQRKALVEYVKAHHARARMMH